MSLSVRLGSGSLLRVELWKTNVKTQIKTHQRSYTAIYINFIALNSVCQIFTSVFISQVFVGATIEANLKRRQI